MEIGVVEGEGARPHNPSWPVARTYRGEHRVRISLPVGGIGTGSIGFGGRGQYRDWELENHPSKGLRSELTFLACRVSGTTTAPVARVLEGNLFDEETEGALGSPAPLAGLPRFAECEFETTYPFGRARLSDPNFPVQASVEVFNPLSPGDAEISGLPIGVITVALQSLVQEPLDCDVMLSLEALVGHARRSAGSASNPRAVARSEGDIAGYLVSDEAVDPADEDWGTIAAAVLGEGSWVGPTWGLGKWNQGLLHMWRGFTEHGQALPGTFAAGSDEPAITFGSAIAGTLGARRVLGPHEAAEVVFLIGWHFPNRRAWAWGRRGPGGASGPETVGNFYAKHFADAWDVVKTQAQHLPAFREITERFAGAFWESDLSPAVKEAALFNLSTLRSQTFFRDADGHPLGWEGCLDEAGSCPGSCTHVWNYDLATPFLFASLARQMRELEYLHATAEDGAMSFRIMLPLEKALEHRIAAADGQFGSVLKLFREWRLGGDDEWLKRIWPACRRSLEFAWVEGGWDADHDGLAEGAQHNTMDIEYYGPNPEVQSWYLAALAAAVEMARAVGDGDFAQTCQEVLRTGRASTEAALYNGLYYQQRVLPPDDFSNISPRLRHASMGAQNASDPEFQVADGCLIDQLVGDTYARLAGLSRLLDADHVKSALSSIHNLNYVPDFGDWTNYMRTYAVKGERGHIVLSYPHGLPEHPMPYWCEVWTGLEYVYAIGLVHEGLTELAEDVVAAARSRFSGRRRNPFDEVECGHHYARALSSWGLVLAQTGFGYDGRAGTMTFAPAPDRTKWFWSSGAAWGTVEQALSADGQRAVSLEVMDGRVRVDRLVVGTATFRPGIVGDLSRGNYRLREDISISSGDEPS
jgi:non-lysosomal glucosylceramidase